MDMDLSILDFIAEGVCILNEKREIVFMNDSALKMLEYKKEDVTGKNVHQLLHSSKDGGGKYEEGECPLCSFLNDSKGKSSNDGVFISKTGRKIFVNYKVSFRGISQNLKGGIITFSDIGEMKEYQDLLKESRDDNEMVFQLVPSAIFTIDLNKKILSFNHKAEELTGYKAKEIIGKSCMTFALEPCQANCSMFDKTIEKPITCKECTIRRKDGKIRIISKNADILKNSVGKIIGGVESFEDITERKELETRLENKEKIFSAIVTSAQDAIVMMDNAGNITFWNPAAEKILGWKASEVMGKDLHTLIVPVEYYPAHVKAFPSFQKSGKGAAIGKTLELKAIKKDGSEIFIELGISAVKLDDVWNAVGILRDITARKKFTEQNLIFMKASEDINLSMVITDTDGNIEYVNPKFCEVTGYSSEDAIGQNPRVLKSGEMPKEVYETLWDTIKLGNSWTGEFHNKKKNGELYWESAVISGIKDEKGKVIKFIAIKEDITKAKILVEELKIAKKDAEDATKAKSEFLANMSHEIRTPMNSIIGMTEILMDTKLEQEQKKYAKNIQNSSEALLGIINDILDISKIESGLLKLENIAYNPREVLESVAEMFAQQAGVKGLELILKIPNNMPQNIMGDPTRLRQIFINLVGNAFKFTTKGQIKIEAEYIEDLKKIKFAVVDTGIGISKGNQKKIFEKFSQADSSTTRKFGGTGLGLSISRAFVDLMGGELSIESELKKGTTFYFEVLCIEAKVKKTEEEILDFNGFKALVIDDNKDSLEIIKENLSVWGFSASTRLSSVQSLKLIKKNPLAFNIIIIDHQMPIMDGLELVKKINELYPKHPFKILMMSSMIEKIPTEIKEDVIDGFLSKPITKSGLFNSIVGTFQKKIISEERTVSEVVSEKSKTYLKILVAEDNADNQNLIRILLKKSGYSFDIVSNGKEAVAACSKFMYDLVFLDIQMPVMDGYEAIGLIRELKGYKEIPILALTAHGLDRDIKKSLDAGMNEHITKPIKKRKLYEVIHKWIDSRKKVLVVDDSDDNRFLVKNYLKKENDIVLFFAINGKEALNSIGQRNFSLVFMDMEMPIMDGLTAVKKLRKSYSKEALPIIAFSAHNDASKIKEFLDAGCNDCLVKPFKKLALIEKIKTYIV
jgi:PAS domain S-box-containing protein